MNSDQKGIVGVIIAGGLSRRMKGQDKCLLPLANKPLINHAIDRLAPQVSLVVINTNGDTERFDSDLPTVKDPVDGFAGPLAGVLAGLQWASRQSEISHIVTVAADTPFFPNTLVERLLTSLVQSNSKIAVAQSLGRNHPVFAIWSINLEYPLENWLKSGKSSKVLTFIEEFKHSFVTFDDCLLKNPSPDPFFNVNRPEDLTRAHTIYEELTA